MIESWRWFGPVDKISLSEVRQTGARGIVTALHEIPYGEIWSIEAIRQRIALLEADRGLELSWQVVESLPVHENIKRGSGNLDVLFANYRQSIVNLAKCGVKRICYNFMPLLDWTRTDLDAPLPGGGTALRFSMVKMAAFDCFMLKRKGAEDEYTDTVLEHAKSWFQSSSDAERQTLLASIMAGLPGAYDRYDIPGLTRALEKYDGLSAEDLRANFKRFLDEIIPTAEAMGVLFCVHPDDPPRPILGLPRIVSTAGDVAWVLAQRPEYSNGLTLCTGSLGANPDNDLVEIAKSSCERIHFAHLRNVRREADGSFQESDHLDGDNDMISIIKVLLGEEQRRQNVGNSDNLIPFRPDHGHELASDLGRGTHPGYPLIGRLRGLAELRGVIAALDAMPN